MSLGTLAGVFVAAFPLFVTAAGCGGRALIVDSDAGAGSSPATCTSICNQVATTCNGTNPQCVPACEQNQAQCASAGARAAFQALLDCLASATLTCSSGQVSSNVCQRAQDALASACNNVGMPPDAGIIDVTPPPPPPPPPPPEDASPPDAGVGPNCNPNKPFTPVPWAPPTPFTKSCTAQQISDYGTCLTSGDCSAFRATAANASCVSCLETDIGSAAHGPVVTVIYMGAVTPYEGNFGGCIANLDGNTSKFGCGASFNTYDDCYNSDCGGCADAKNPTPSGPTAMCQKAAFSSGTCNSFAITGACSQEVTPDAGVASRCDSVQGLLGTWCGGG